jgi:hypothetical protein
MCKLWLVGALLRKICRGFPEKETGFALSWESLNLSILLVGAQIRAEIDIRQRPLNIQTKYKKVMYCEAHSSSAYVEFLVGSH